jgi:ABC-type transport system substrate-binding protein
MRQGFLDPLAPMTFKILPRDQRADVNVNSEAFAVNPVTSGPFRVDRDRQSDEKNRECRFFVANPYYRLRPSKHGAPHLQEVRFYTYNDAVDEMSKGTLDLVLDLTAEEAQKLARGQLEVPLPSRTVPNRRIYFLAINTKKLEPFGVDLRRAISCAIDRETLLTKHFRGPLKEVHKALAGPFPVGSWACKRNPAAKGTPTLFDPDTAHLLKEQQSVRQAAQESSRTPWKLQYTDDHPALEKALKDLCDQVKALTGVVLEPARCSPQQLRENVEVSKAYEVAYYHYDFPDDTYWLGPLFGKPPEADQDQNIFRYQKPQLTQLLDGVKSFRSFAKVQEYQWETQELLNREMPFVPLWQLDPLLAYRRDVQPKALDPQQPFSNLEEWHLLRK